MTACCISLSRTLKSCPSQVTRGRRSQFISLIGSKALLSWTNNIPPHPYPLAPRRNSVFKLETTVSRISLRTLWPAANQSWDQPQSISECPGLKAPTEPLSFGASSYPGNPKPPSIIVLAFVIRWAGPQAMGWFTWLRKTPASSWSILSSPTRCPLCLNIGVSPTGNLSLNFLSHRRSNLAPLQQPAQGCSCINSLSYCSSLSLTSLIWNTRLCRGRYTGTDNHELTFIPGPFRTWNQKY